MSEDNKDFGIIPNAQGFPAIIDDQTELILPKVNTETYMIIKEFSAAGGNTIEDFIESFATASMRYPTGLDFIDEVTHGGIYNGLTILAGLPNIGKTTFLIALSVEMAYRGHPVVYITKDMAKNELILKVLSYISNRFKEGDAYSISDISNMLSGGQPIPEKLLQLYRKTCRNLHIRDIGNGADIGFYGILLTYLSQNATESFMIGRIVEFYTETHAKKPLFIIDSLQSIAIETNKSAKEGVDCTLVYLKGIQRKYNVPIIAVSNLSRVSYGKDITIASLKESGNVEYEASSILALDVNRERYNGEINLDELRNAPKRYLVLKNLKDRAGGYVGIPITFHAEESMFYKTEVPLAKAKKPSKTAKKNSNAKSKEILNKIIEDVDESSKNTDK